MYKSEVIGKGGIRARVVAHSIANGIPLITYELRYPRFIHSEVMTHRVFSRNASSSRAIPVNKMIEQVRNDPAIPIHWGKNRPGMQAREEHELGNTVIRPYWLEAAEEATRIAFHLNQMKVHKQVVNRLLEPFQFINVVLTGTEWDNYFQLRDHEAAQPEIQELARCMKQAMERSTPYNLQEGEWHLPYVDIQGSPSGAYYVNHDGHEMELDDAIKCSVARCARVSYMKHDNTNPSIEDDIDLYNALVTRPYTMKNGMHLPEGDPIHASPAEHICSPMTEVKQTMCPSPWPKGATHLDKAGNYWSGNMRGWIQYRQLLPNHGGSWDENH